MSLTLALQSLKLTPRSMYIFFIYLIGLTIVISFPIGAVGINRLAEHNRLYAKSECRVTNCTIECRCDPIGYTGCTSWIGLMTNSTPSTFDTVEVTSQQCHEQCPNLNDLIRCYVRGSVLYLQRPEYHGIDGISALAVGGSLIGCFLFLCVIFGFVHLLERRYGVHVAHGLLSEREIN